MEEREIVRQRFWRGSPGVIRVSTLDAQGGLVSQVETEVTKPESPERQYDQLVRLVQDEMPDARLTTSAPGEVKFACRGHVIVAAYVDVPAQASSAG